MSQPDAWALDLPPVARTWNYGLLESANARQRLAERLENIESCARGQPSEPSGNSSSNSRGIELLAVPSTVDGLRAAICALKLSTKSIERRTVVFSTQASHANVLTHTQDGIQDQKASHVHRVSQKQAVELQHAKFANEQLLGSLCTEIRDEVYRETKTTNSVSATALATLASDDGTLTELNDETSSARAKKTGAPNVEMLQYRANRLTRALQLFHAEALRDRLDRIYLESLSTVGVSGDNRNTLDASSITLGSVNEDLSSLYAEIDDVETMVISHAYGSALRASLQNIRRAQIQEIQTMNEKVHGKICFMTEVLDRLSTTMDTVQAQRYILNDVRIQVSRIEKNGRSHPDPSSVPARPERTDTLLAAHALLQHLNLPADTTRSFESADLTKNTDNLTMKLDQLSFDNINQVLQTSKQAITARCAALNGISGALATNDWHAHTIHALENGIAAAKQGIEEEAMR